MATLKHINSKNADYGAAEQYLLFEHDEFTMKPVLDETGRLIPREDYRLSTLNCGGEDFAVACMRANLRYGKNQRREDVKSHHYIISFDPRDGPDNGLTVDRAQELGEKFCAEHFPGHQALVCTHPDGHNHSGNIHVHIVINSLRIEEVPFLPYMDRPADTKAGCKHRCTDAALRYFKSEVMEMCHREGLYQIDLLNGSKNRVTDREYWAQKKGQAALDKQNAPMIAGGITPRQTKFETNKEKLRQTIRAALSAAASFEDFSSLLLREGVTVKESRGRLSYLTPDRTKPISARKLGDDFDRAAVLAVLEQNAARAAEKAAAISSTPPSIQDQLRADRAARTAPNVQRLVDIEQKKAEGKDLVKSGLSVKDAIAPTAFAFKNSRTFQMGGIYCAASFLSITASDISDQLLKDFLDMDSSQIVTMHIQSVDQNKAIKTVKRTITELDRSKIEEQKKAIRAGYDIDIIPSDLATYGRDAKALLKELQSQNERMFLVTFLVLNTGRTEQELENNVFQASSIAQKHNCNLCRLDFQQEQGLMSSLPLADCQIEIQRGLTTSSTAIFIPFTTQELYQSGKESLYYGLNALSNNLIMVDRKKLKNPNGLILGTPGSGKSFSAKREITNAFLVTDDDIIVNDPEGEYSPLVNRLKGQVIKISPNSTQFINPMDINANYSEEDNPLSLKADFILSLCELVVGGKEGLLPVEKTVIDRCVHLIYRKYFANPCPENMPILEDLYNALLQQDEKEAHHVATALEIYVKGSLNLFNHRTNVNVNNRIVCYDIKELGKQMKKLGMLIVQDQVWGRVTANRSSGKSTRYYMDEMHLLLKEEQTAAYSVEIWKRFRKWGGIPTGLTQNVKDLLSSREVENIFENSDMIIMLNQAAGDRQILAKQLNISPHQLSYVTHSGEGEGLLFFGNVILPFVDRFPTDLELYRIMTTKLGEVSEGQK